MSLLLFVYFVLDLELLLFLLNVLINGPMRVYIQKKEKNGLSSVFFLNFKHEIKEMKTIYTMNNYKTHLNL